MNWYIVSAVVMVLVAVYLHLGRKVIELRKRANELALLNEFSERLQRSETIDEARALLPAYGEHLFPRLDGAVYIARSKGGLLELAASWGESLSCRDERDALFCVPLPARGEAVGALTLRARDGRRIRGGLPLAGKFGDQIALATTNLRLREALRAHAVRDELTGLFNRRYMQEVLVRELRQCGEHDEREVGVILVDVDNFKPYNDTWGHAAGDALLQQFGRLMHRVFREEDVVCRFGGEEFVIVLPNASWDLVRSSAEMLRAESHQLHVHLDGQLLGGITVSAGMAVAPSDGTTPETLLASADRALYAAKSSGRDRVAVPPSRVVAA